MQLVWAFPKKCQGVGNTLVLSLSLLTAWSSKRHLIPKEGNVGACVIGVMHCALGDDRMFAAAFCTPSVQVGMLPLIFTVRNRDSSTPYYYP